MSSGKVNIFATPSQMVVKPTTTEFSPPSSGRVEIPFSSYNSLESLYKEFKTLGPEISGEFEKRMDEILVYTALAENSRNFTDESGRVAFLAKLSYGFRKSGEALAWATTKRRKAEGDLKRAQAVAAMDEFSDWLKVKKLQDKDFKATADARKSYSQMSSTVVEAYNVLAALDGMSEYLFTAKSELKDAISTLRSIMYGKSDSNSVGWGSGGTSGV